jgi:hypothetical protein
MLMFVPIGYDSILVLAVDKVPDHAALGQRSQ